MLFCNKLSVTVKQELFAVKRILQRIIPSAIGGGMLILLSWFYFGGPCRVSLFFKIPGGGFTIALYYVLWFFIFILCGGEAALICSYIRRCDSKILLYHIAVHLCLFLWYPLFFTSFSQFLSLLILISGLILLILQFVESKGWFIIFSASIFVKIIVVAVFVYINLAFLIIN